MEVAFCEKVEEEEVGVWKMEEVFCGPREIQVGRTKRNTEVVGEGK